MSAEINGHPEDALIAGMMNYLDHICYFERRTMNFASVISEK
jgi:hypothetical protein